MNRKSWAFWVLSGSLLTCTGAAQAQEAMPDGPPPPMVMLQAAGMEEGPGPVGAFGERIELLGFGGMHGGKVVKGAPFSAVAVSESTQTLADGNQITRKTQTNLYRDSQGRFRREVTLPAIGLLAASGQPHSLVMINDPVAGANYVLEVDEKIARKMQGPGRMGGGPKGGNGDIVYRDFKKASEASVKKESLGTQVINGVSAEGTRFTRTIAAGEIGNVKPITVVSERWYSADLQMDVKSTHSDPRFGDTTYTLTGVQRQEPAAALFTVPADYTVQEGGPGIRVRKFQGEAPPPPPPPGN
jgi:hypothetical protein